MFVSFLRLLSIRPSLLTAYCIGFVWIFRRIMVGILSLYPPALNFIFTEVFFGAMLIHPGSAAEKHSGISTLTCTTVRCLMLSQVGA